MGSPASVLHHMGGAHSQLVVEDEVGASNVDLQNKSNIRFTNNSVHEN